jgi:cytochrome c-type biogenesis protein CcmH/NrfF
VRALAAALVVLVLAPPAALAACPRTSLGDIEDEVMCLQCGVPLNVAEDAPAAKRERAFIQAQIDRCKSKDEIKSMLVAQFGDRVLAEPQGGGAWVVPAIGFAAGAAIAGFAAYRWRRDRRALARSGPTPTPAGLAPGDAARLDADLDRYEP